jgi:hypothetical protein
MLRSAIAWMLPPRPPSPPLGPAARHVLLAPEGRRAVAAGAGVHLDHRFVDELHAGPRR